MELTVGGGAEVRPAMVKVSTMLAGTSRDVQIKDPRVTDSQSVNPLRHATRGAILLPIGSLG